MELRDKTNVADRVCNLLAHLPMQGHIVYIDRWYTSLELVRRAYDEYGCHLCGTCRSDRGFPKDLQETQLKLEKGEWDWRYHPNMHTFAYAWRDSAHVQMLSSFHQPQRAEVLRRAHGSADRVTVPTSQAFADFNMYMGGNDVADSRRSRYSIHRPSMKFWKSPFYWSIDTAMVASDLVYNQIVPEHRQLSHVKSIEAVALALIQGEDPNRLANPDDSERELLPYIPPPKKQRLSLRNPPPQRLLGRNHWPSLAQGNIGSRKEHRRGRCVLCKTEKRVRTRCESCNVFLCLEHNHFEVYHTEKELEKQ